MNSNDTLVVAALIGTGGLLLSALAMIAALVVSERR